MNVNVYVDGFNFYYGCFKSTDPRCTNHSKLKWVDLRTLSELIRPGDSIKRLHYCTAKVGGSLKDPDQPIRQEIYLSALRTVPGLQIHLGSFKSRSKKGPIIGPPHVLHKLGGSAHIVEIMTNEEKGSDVNLATHLLHDAFSGDCDAALVISNDSDLAGAIRTARTAAGIDVFVVSPHQFVTTSLKKASSRGSTLDDAVFDKSGAPITKTQLLSMAQFPSPLHDAKGNIITSKSGDPITKPKSW